MTDRIHPSDDYAGDGGTAAPTVPALSRAGSLPVRPRLPALIVTPIPEPVRAALADGRAWARVPRRIARFGGPRTRCLTAAICAAVSAADRGYTAAEMTRAVQDLGVRHVCLALIVKAALAFQVRTGRVNRHLEVVQVRSPRHADDVLAWVTVYTKPLAPGAFESYGGFRDKVCPRCFRGSICAERLHPPGIYDFVHRTVGPITRTPDFLAMQERVRTWRFCAWDPQVVANSGYRPPRDR